MAFLDIRFPDNISYGGTGGPNFSTDVVVINSGFEQRNANWAAARHSYDVSHAARTQAQVEELIAFFRVAQGRANSFRYKDELDYSATVANGLLGTGVGTGLPTYQLYKKYTNAAGTSTRKITRPVSGTLSALRGASPITIGAGAGNVAINNSTGVVTFVADASSGATSVTVGATTTVVLTTNPGTLVAGKKLYLAGFTGADAALLNGLAHTINSVSGTGPYTFVLATNTAAKTITLGSGTGYKYPQASDVLTAAFEFDVPARFDIDQLKGLHIAPGVYGWDSIPIVEVRE